MKGELDDIFESFDKKILYNDKLLYITNSNGLITFGEEENNNSVLIIHSVL